MANNINRNTSKNDEPGPDFTFEEMQNELWDEIDKYVPNFEYRQDGDIDIHQFETHLHNKGIFYSHEYVRKIMREIGEKEGWIRKEVYDANTKKKITVLRKVIKDE